MTSEINNRQANSVMVGEWGEIGVSHAVIERGKVKKYGEAVLNGIDLYQHVLSDAWKREVPENVLESIQDLTKKTFINQHLKVDDIVLMPAKFDDGEFVFHEYAPNEESSEPFMKITQPNQHRLHTGFPVMMRHMIKGAHNGGGDLFISGVRATLVSPWTDDVVGFVIKEVKPTSVCVGALSGSMDILREYYGKDGAKSRFTATVGELSQFMNRIPAR